MNAPIVLIAGLGRCGTTLTMHMLAAGGMACVGEAPGYEPRELLGLRREWIDAQAGRAMKMIDPHAFGFPPPTQGSPSVRTIWLDRNPVEQARSQAKFAHMVGGLPMPNRDHMRRWTRGLPTDRRAALKALKVASAAPGLMMDFEALLGLPVTAAAAIAEFLAPDFPNLDVGAMAAVVRDRPTSCAPDLAIELDLIAKAEAA